MEHVLQLYQEEHCLLDALAGFVAAGLREDEGVLIVGSTPRWELLLDRLRKHRIAAASHMAGRMDASALEPDLPLRREEGSHGDPVRPIAVEPGGAGTILRKTLLVRDR